MPRAVRLFCSCIITAMVILLPVTDRASAGDISSGSFTIPIVITGVHTSGITTSSAVITWNTNDLADSKVYYDKVARPSETQYFFSTPVTTALVTAHTITLQGLQPKTVYHYRVRSRKDVGGTIISTVSDEFTFTTVASPPNPVTETPAETPTPDEPAQDSTETTEEPEDKTPQEDTETLPESTESVITIARIDTSNEPVARDDEGNLLMVTGNLITVTKEAEQLTVNIPVPLQEGRRLSSFTDAGGLVYKDNLLIIPAASSEVTGRFMLKISDEAGDLGTMVIIETEDAIGNGDKTIALVRSIKAHSGFASKDFTHLNNSLGIASSTVALTLRQLPENGQVIIRFELEPEAKISDTFKDHARANGLGEIVFAYCINTDKTNLLNDIDIVDATITMIAGEKRVAECGGPEAFRILRYDTDTGTTRILDTSFIRWDELGRGVFEAFSPDGLSVFALSGRYIAEPDTGSDGETDGETLSPVTEKNYLWLLYTGIGITAIIAFFWFFLLKKRRRSKDEDRE